MFPEPSITDETFEAARAALEAGGCIGLPTDTVYGVAARLDDPAAVAALFELKGREETKAMAVLVDSAATAAQLGDLDGGALELVRRWWPGPLTVVVRRRDDGPLEVRADLGGDPDTIGIRCPDHDLVRRLAAAVGPLVTTSANRSGEPTMERAEEISVAFGSRLALVVDGGTIVGSASTVVDLRSDPPRILRSGPISAADLGLCP